MHHVQGFGPLPADLRGAAVALGNFDGVHLGHQAILRAAKATAAGAPHGVVTFEPHPRQVLREPDRPFRLTSAAGKARALEDAGAGLLVEIPFDREFAQHPPEEFVRWVLVDVVGAAQVVVGFDFRFGADRSGTADTLRELGGKLDFTLTQVEQLFSQDGEPFSSTNIRARLREGQPLAAAQMLGRWWEVDGVVQSGHQRGQTIGFPTANLTLGELLEPALGVYIVRCSIGEGADLAWFGGVANLGRRPTVDGETLLLETHVFDFAGDLYDKPMRVQLLDFIRPERKFESFDALKDQIAKDSETARQVLPTIPNQPI